MIPDMYAEVSGEGPTLRFVSEPPLDHEHNNWETARINKKRVATIRCRECQLQVKIMQPLVIDNRCDVFFLTGDCSNADCKKLHMNQYKQSLEERYLVHGARVLENVPQPYIEDREHVPQRDVVVPIGKLLEEEE
eukprot:TRINITY_DN716_c0_g1_i5.p2 TRINITY_DN716_c0_g1~~TRINITY_DN716_c0_g1_i5.p2  ORF type:complete len:135 (+),score=49.37 TRINITY_DN716_c0_g1_i5:49-453(+)